MTLTEVKIENMKCLIYLIKASGKVTTPEQIAYLERIEGELARLKELREAEILKGVEV